MNHPSAEQLALHAGGDLPVPDAQAVDRHLTACELCRREVAEIASSMEAFRSLAPELPSSALQQWPSRRMIPWSRIAAAAAIIIVAASGVYRVARNSEPEVARKSARDAIATETSHPESEWARPSGPRLRPAEIPAISKPARMATRKSSPGRELASRMTLEEVSRTTENGDPAELRLATSNPKVVVLWQINDANDGTDQGEKR